MPEQRGELRAAFASDFAAEDSRPHRAPERHYFYNEPAYRFGWETARHLRVRKLLEQAEPTMKEGWLSWMVGNSAPALEWRELQEAVRYAWLRKRGF